MKGTSLKSGISGNQSDNGRNEENSPGRDSHPCDRRRSLFSHEEGKFGTLSARDFSSIPGGESLVEREDLHTRVTRGHKYHLKHLAELMNVQGKRMTIGMIIDEALDCYKLEEKCRQEQEKARNMFKS